MRMTMGGALLAIALSACSQHATAPAAAPTAVTGNASVHPESGLEVIDLVVTHGLRNDRFRVEVARTSEQQERGLMFRHSMGADEGMLFPMQPPRLASFWMRNTVLPLDIIFIGENGRVTNIAANAVPYDETPLPSLGKASAVLELNAGRAAALEIVPGAKVTWGK